MNLPRIEVWNLLPLKPQDSPIKTNQFTVMDAVIRAEKFKRDSKRFGYAYIGNDWLQQWQYFRDNPSELFNNFVTMDYVPLNKNLNTVCGKKGVAILIPFHDKGYVYLHFGLGVDGISILLFTDHYRGIIDKRMRSLMLSMEYYINHYFSTCNKKIEMQTMEF